MARRSAEVVILTVVPAELEWAKKAFGVGLGGRCRVYDTVYWQTEALSRLTGVRYRIALTCIGFAGNYDAAAAATEAIIVWRPRLVVLMGIAAGLRGRIKIGEVVLSERVLAYEPGELRDPSTAGHAFIARPEMPRVAHRLRQDVVNYWASFNRDRVEGLFFGIGGAFPTPAGQHDPADFAAHVATRVLARDGTVASGEKLLRDPAKLYSLRTESHGRVEAGEMEAAGLATACWRQSLPWFVVRGISDFGDHFKSDEFHQFASSTAAILTRDFLEYGLDLTPIRGRRKAVPTLPDPQQIADALTTAANASFAVHRATAREQVTSLHGGLGAIPLSLSRRFKGIVFRLARSQFAASTPDRRFAAGPTGVLYFALTPADAMESAFARQGTAADNVVPQQYVLMEVKVNLHHVLDVSKKSIRRRLAINIEDVGVSIADWARASGFEAILVPNTKARGRMLVILNAVRIDSAISIRSIQPIDH